MGRLQIYNNLCSGQLLIEALVGLAIASIVLPALFLGFFATKQGKAQQNQRIQAVALMKEAEEAVRSVREKGWASFAIDGVFYPVIINNAWSLSAGTEDISGLNRSVTISDVERDANGVVVPSGTKDPSTKKVDIKISWGQPYASSVDSTMYVTRYLQNTANTQTTFADFSSGIASGTAIFNQNGGEVKLGIGGGGGDWCIPIKSITEVDLSRQGVPTSISAYVGNIVTGTGLNASGPTFVKVAVAGNNPPNATIQGQFNNSKANGVFTESTYGYIATTSNSQEIKILDLSSASGDPPLYSVVGWFDAPGNGQGDTIYVANNVGYMTDLTNFYTFSLSSHTGSRSKLNTGTTLAGNGKKIVVVGNYAYVATDSTTTQLQIINITNPASPTIVASANLGNGQPATNLDVSSDGTRAYVVTSYAGSSQPDFFVVDTSVKSGSLSTIGPGFNTGGMSPSGVQYAVGKRAIIVGSGGTNQYQVVKLDPETSPLYCGGISIANGAYDVSSVIQPDGYAYSYVVTGDARKELKMILGGAGGQYAPSGTFTSKPFDALATVAFNYFTPTFDLPSQTTLKFQVSASNPSDGNCDTASYDYVGPDGTSASYYTSGGAIPLVTNGNYSNPGRCLRYRAYFTTSDFSVSPTLSDVSVNYSP